MNTFIKLLRFALILAFLVIHFAAMAQGAEVRVIAISADRSFDSNLPRLRYSRQDAIQFAKAMEVVGMVPEKNVSVLHNATLRQAREALTNFAKTAPSQERGKFILYFSGHSDEAGLHLPDGLLRKDEMQRLMERVPAATKVAILDSCFSGGLAGKGIARDKEFELPRVNFDEPSGTIFLTASSERDRAFESERFASSIFTHNLVAGLYGEADFNRDGIVTVDEAYQYIYQATKVQLLNLPSQIVQRPTFVSDLQGQGAVILSFPVRADASLDLAEDVAGDFTIASPKGLSFFQVAKKRGERRRLKLPSGDYRIAVADGKQMGEGKVSLLSQGTRLFASNDISWGGSDVITTRSKGDCSTCPEITTDSETTSIEPQWIQTRPSYVATIGMHTGFGEKKDGLTPQVTGEARWPFSAWGPTAFALRGIATALTQRVTPNRGVNYQVDNSDQKVRYHLVTASVGPDIEFVTSSKTIEKLGIFACWGYGWMSQRSEGSASTGDQVEARPAVSCAGASVDFNLSFLDRLTGIYRYEKLEAQNRSGSNTSVFGQTVALGYRF